MIIKNSNNNYIGYIDKIINNKHNNAFGCITYALYNLEVYLGIADSAVKRCQEISLSLNEYELNSEKVARIDDYYFFLFETYSSNYDVTFREEFNIEEEINETIANNCFKLVLISDNDSEIAHLSSLYKSNNKLYIDGAETSLERLLLTLTRDNTEIISISKKQPH